jgi:hypothetical protein
MRKFLIRVVAAAIALMVAGPARPATERPTGAIFRDEPRDDGGPAAASTIGPSTTAPAATTGPGARNPR